MKKIEPITTYLRNITYLFEVLPFIFYLANFKKLDAKDRRLFFVYTLSVASFIIVGIVGRYYFSSLNFFYYVSRVYDVMEYSMLAYFFSLNTKSKIVKTLLIYSIIPFFIYCIYDFISAKQPGFAFFSLIIECLALLIVLLYIFYEKMQYSFDTPLHQTYFFWIAVAFILYFAGNFFLFLYSKNSYHDEVFKTQYTIIYSTVTIIKDIFLCISAFIKDVPKPDKENRIENIFDSYHPFSNQT